MSEPDTDEIDDQPADHERVLPSVVEQANGGKNVHAGVEDRARHDDPHRIFLRIEPGAPEGPRPSDGEYEGVTWIPPDVHEARGEPGTASFAWPGGAGFNRPRGFHRHVLFEVLRGRAVFRRIIDSGDALDLGVRSPPEIEAGRVVHDNQLVVSDGVARNPGKQHHEAPGRDGHRQPPPTVRRPRREERRDDGDRECGQARGSREGARSERGTGQQALREIVVPHGPEQEPECGRQEQHRERLRPDVADASDEEWIDGRQKRRKPCYGRRCEEKPGDLPDENGGE